MRVIIRNALIGATISSVLAAILLLFVDHQLRDALTISQLPIYWTVVEQLAADILYMWCGAVFSALIYGALAMRMGSRSPATIYYIIYIMRSL